MMCSTFFRYAAFVLGLYEFAGTGMCVAMVMAVGGSSLPLDMELLLHPSILAMKEMAPGCSFEQVLRRLFTRRTS